jgi:hypothetical protein
VGERGGGEGRKRGRREWGEGDTKMLRGYSGGGNWFCHLVWYFFRRGSVGERMFLGCEVLVCGRCVEVVCV